MYCCMGKVRVEMAFYFNCLAASSCCWPSLLKEEALQSRVQALVALAIENAAALPVKYTVLIFWFSLVRKITLDSWLMTFLLLSVSSVSRFLPLSVCRHSNAFASGPCIKCRAPGDSALSNWRTVQSCEDLDVSIITSLILASYYLLLLSLSPLRPNKIVLWHCNVTLSPRTREPELECSSA